MLFWMPWSNREKGHSVWTIHGYSFSHLIWLNQERLINARETRCSNLTISRLLHLQDHLQGKKTDLLKNAIIEYFSQLSTYESITSLYYDATLHLIVFILNLIKPRTLHISKDKNQPTKVEFPSNVCIRFSPSLRTDQCCIL